MKFKLIYPAVIILSFLISCKSEKAKKFSDLIVQKQSAIETDIAQATKKLQVYFISDETDSIVSVSTKMEDQINSVISDIQKTKAPKLKEAENFKQESLKYLEYRKDLFTIYKNYGLQTSVDGREMERKNMVAVQSMENIMNYNLEVAQKNFAKANHVKIKQN